MKSEDNQQETVNAQVSINSENQISGLYRLYACIDPLVTLMVSIVVNKINKSNPSKNSLILQLIFLPIYIYIFLFCKGKKSTV